jgi:hypothetical protein
MLTRLPLLWLSSVVTLLDQLKFAAKPVVQSLRNTAQRRDRLGMDWKARMLCLLDQRSLIKKVVYGEQGEKFYTGVDVEKQHLGFADFIAAALVRVLNLW